TDPATRFSGGAVGNCSFVGVRSATVTYLVALTNRSYCSLVAAVLSIQKASRYTRCHGCASGNSLDPIQNSPPGTRTICAGPALSNPAPANAAAQRIATTHRLRTMTSERYPSLESLHKDTTGLRKMISAGSVGARLLYDKLVAKHFAGVVRLRT